MKSLSIKRLLLISALLIGLLMGTLLVTNQLQLNAADRHAEHQAMVVESMMAIKDARYHVVQIQQFLTDVSATGDVGPFADAEENLTGALASLDRLATVMPPMQRTVDELKQKAQRLHQVGVEMANAYINEGQAAGNAIMKRPGSGLDDASASLAEQLEAVVEGQGRELAVATEMVEGSLHHASSVVNWLGLVVIVLMGLISFFYYRRLIPPLNELTESMNDIASGSRDLTVTLKVHGDDEIGQVAKGFNTFVANIRSLVEQVVKTSLQLASAGDQMSALTDQTLKGMRRLQGETDQVATAMTEMNATLQEVADNAGLASESAQQSDHEAQHGQQVVGRTTASIDALAGRVGEAGEAINRLEGDVDNIGSILDVIRGIAEQTNLLALNAAIEAARAGEQGRGFAVVADEVRTLASRTQQSTEEIHAKIEQLQAGVNETVRVMNEGREQAEVSVRQAAEAGESLGNITSAVGTITEMNQQIAGAVDAQTTAADAINSSVVTISQEAEKTVENARNVELAVSTMGGLLDELNQVVKHFHVGNAGGLDLSAAKSAHLAWKSRLRAFLDGKSTLSEEQAVSHHHFEFGKWYYSDAGKAYQHIAAMRELEAPHAELHRLIKHIIQLTQEQKLDQAEQAFGQVETLSQRIVGLLSEVETAAA